MVSEQIRKTLAIQPFRPFQLHLADGRVLRVRHPEFIYVPPKNERTVYITDDDGDVEIVDALMIVSLKPTKSGEPRRRKAG